MRRRRLLGLGLVVVAAGGVTAAAGMSALSAADRLERAQAELAAVRDGDSDVDGTLLALRRAAEQVDGAQHELHRWPVDVVAAVPVLGRSLDAERAVSATAEHVITGAALLAERLPSVRAGAGGVDLAALDRARRDLDGPVDRARTSMAHLRRTSGAMTPPQVSRGLADAEAALGPAVTTLERAHAGLGVLSGLLGADGPRNVLVMLQNNAELRGAGGYAASFATGRLQGGRVALGPLRDVVRVGDPPEQARRVPAPPAYLQDYGPLAGNSTMWRSWNMSPHVPDSAQVGARVAGELLGTTPDVVVLLDVPAMGALAALGGQGIPLPNGRTVQPEQLTRALLVESYAEAGTDLELQVARRAELQAAASSAVSRLLAGDVPAADAARTLGTLAAQRHLSVWSARPHEQRALVRLGVAGAVTPPPDGGDLSHVSINNLGGNKLDVHVERAVGVDVVVGEREAAVRQQVRLTNRAPAGLVPYVAGFERPGVAVGLAELSLPPEATAVTATVDGKPWTGPLRTAAADSGRSRLSTRIELDRGASATLQVRYRLPLSEGRYRLRLVPQPLARDAELRLSVRPADGHRLGAVSGAGRSGGSVTERTALDRTRDVSVRLAAPSRWQRLQDWWDAPVQVG